jgi:hypothetical protein
MVYCHYAWIPSHYVATMHFAVVRWTAAWPVMPHMAALLIRAALCDLHLFETDSYAHSSYAHRGPGDFPGILIIENIVEHVAASLHLDPELVRMRNFWPPPPGFNIPGAFLRSTPPCLCKTCACHSMCVCVCVCCVWNYRHPALHYQCVCLSVPVGSLALTFNVLPGSLPQ